jgi:hypothetical protein
MALVSGCSGQRPDLAEQTTPTASSVPTGAIAAMAKVATDDALRIDLTQTATPRQRPITISSSTEATATTRTIPTPAASPTQPVFIILSSTETWVQVWMPWLGDKTAPEATGWVRGSDIVLARHTFRMVIDRAKSTVTVFRSGKQVIKSTASIAPGCLPSPRSGLATSALLQPEAGSPYGSKVIAVSALPDVLPVFGATAAISAAGAATTPATAPMVLIHGTTDELSVGQPVTTGCVRLRNADVDAIARLLPLGVPVTVL